MVTGKGQLVLRDRKYYPEEELREEKNLAFRMNPDTKPNILKCETERKERSVRIKNPQTHPLVCLSLFQSRMNSTN